MGVQDWLRHAMPEQLSTSAVPAAAHELDPHQLVTYLARRGWRYSGLMPGSDDIAAWSHHSHAGPVTVSLCLDRLLARGATTLLLIHALERIATFEHRDTDQVLADIIRTPTPPNTLVSGDDYQPAPAAERRMRADYTVFRSELYDRNGTRVFKPTTASLQRALAIESRWLHNLEGLNTAWIRLHTTVEAWHSDSESMARLHAVLAAYPDSVDAANLRDHDQARVITGNPPHHDPPAAAFIAMNSAAVLARPAAHPVNHLPGSTNPESAATEALGSATESGAGVAM
ncbi:hypothetical protein [Nocardia suismassiliense]|uniref:hypothetical protein n=1 Tax=Nocardia suismassiliense TaxID=2077092 RepID=UPI000D1F68DD|nr:hypothetical protein [Nocardia suismassiliense]